MHQIVSIKVVIRSRVVVSGRLPTISEAVVLINVASLVSRNWLIA